MRDLFFGIGTFELLILISIALVPIAGLCTALVLLFRIWRRSATSVKPLARASDSTTDSP